jgi:MoaA/NifB/PqqE/SkfB family radical SAM enzyme
MYAAGKLDEIHLELTTKCNAACPMCARNINGGPNNPDLPLVELELADIQAIWPVPWTGSLATVRYMMLCGNYGDPILVRDLIEILQYVRSIRPEISFGIHTNGSLRTPKWWRELALTSNKQDTVTFGIDGLEDTNHLHRRHTDFNKIMENAASFIAAGGTARWVYLVFKHNEHQVDAAEKLARNMGFESFILKKTPRFTAPEHQVINRDGTPAYTIQPSDLAMPTKDFRAGSGCRTWQTKSIYITAEGLVFPCCWLGHPYSNQFAQQITDLVETIGKDSINIRLHSIDEIMQGTLFREIIGRWNNTPLQICTKKCGMAALHAEN